MGGRERVIMSAMDARKILAAVVSLTVAAAGLVLLVPLAAGQPSWLPDWLVPVALRGSETPAEYHGYIPAELVGVALMGFCLWLYFRIAEPAVIRPRYQPKRSGRHVPR
jgi:integral membrane sensor domain MASE1